MIQSQTIYYVGAALDEASSLRLASHVRREGEIPLSSEFHCTVMYSRSWFTYRAADAPFPQVLEPPFETTMFGSICVLIFIPSPAIVQRHQGLIAAGARYDYSDYRPHISLCKQACVAPPRFPIVLASEYYGTWRK